MFCKQCGKEMPDGSKFCPHCGVQNAISPSPDLPPVPQLKKRKRGCLLPVLVVVFLISIMAALVGNNFNSEPDVIVNALEYPGKSVEEIQALVGTLENGGRVDLINSNGESVKGEVYYLPDANTHFTFVDGKVVSFQYFSNEPVSYSNTKDIIKMFGITPADNIKQERNTHAAIRWSSVSDNVSDFWVQEMDSGAKTFSTVKITYDSTLAGKFSSEPEKPDLEVLEHTSSHDGYNGYITGKVKNNTNKTYNYAQVSINLYKDDVLLGSTLANINHLGPGEIWEFRAIVLYEDCNQYKIVKVNGF